jgi:hypothetical protein
MIKVNKPLPILDQEEERKFVMNPIKKKESS